MKKMLKSLMAFFLSLRASAKQSSSGVSLIIAIVFVSAFLLVIAGLSVAQLSTIRALGNREQEAKVRYLAESAAELASYAATTHGAGWNLAEGGDATLEGYIWDAAQDLGISSCGETNVTTGASPCAHVQVIGRAADAETLSFLGVPHSSVPINGTGDGAETCANEELLDDACNWNRLYVGQTVEIPLFYVEYDPTTGAESVQKLDASGTGDFLLRIRAPGGEELFPLLINADAYRHIEKDPVLVQWTISGTSIVGGIGRTLVAKDNRAPGTQYRLQEEDSELNTEISGGRINAARAAPYLNDFIVLQQNYQGKNISSQGGSEAQAILTFLSQVDNPVLRLSLVGQPRRNSISGGPSFNLDTDIDNTNFDIPYLEYQLLTDSGHPVSDSKQIVVGWAEFGGFRKKVRREIQREPTLGGFVLEQF